MFTTRHPNNEEDLLQQDFQVIEQAEGQKNGIDLLNCLSDMNFRRGESNGALQGGDPQEPAIGETETNWLEGLKNLQNLNCSIFLVSERNKLMKATLWELLEQEKFYEIKSFLEFIQYVIWLI